MRNPSYRVRTVIALLLLGVTGLFTAGCESGTEGADSYWVTYRVETEAQDQGSAVVHHVFYDGDAGRVELGLDPAQESWSESVLLAPGDTIFLRAEGTVTAGRLVLQIGVQGDDGSVFARTADGMPLSDGEVFIETDQEVLP